MRLKKVTTDFVRANEHERAYNARDWDRYIDRFLANYDDIEFYYAAPTEHTRYEQFFAIYTLPEGLRLLNRFSTSGGISSAGFLGVNVRQVLEDGRDIMAAVEMASNGASKEDTKALCDAINASDWVEINTYKFPMPNGGTGVIATTKEARRWMTEQSKRIGDIFTKEPM